MNKIRILIQILKFKKSTEELVGTSGRSGGKVPGRAKIVAPNQPTNQPANNTSNLNHPQ
jgi:hypothetical protein